MTYHGTNTYLIEGTSGIVVLDPGPADPRHISNIISVAGDRISAVFVTHAHIDHFAAAHTLARLANVPVVAYRWSCTPSFTADIDLEHHSSFEGLTALHTPGHSSDHLCLEAHDGTLFSGDHVMAWNSSAICPPDGNMSDYYNNLEMLLHRADKLYLPAHGPRLGEPQVFVRDLLFHRRSREVAIGEVVARKPHRPRDLVDRPYTLSHPDLAVAAEMNVVAHLQKLQADGLVHEHQGWWTANSNTLI